MRMPSPNVGSVTIDIERLIELARGNAVTSNAVLRDDEIERIVAILLAALRK